MISGEILDALGQSVPVPLGLLLLLAGYHRIIQLAQGGLKARRERRKTAVKED